MMDEGCRLGRMQFVGEAGFEAANVDSNLLGNHADLVILCYV
jgi:hypothetical protein